ncbi:MAG: iron uptake porin [Cyanobacteria bacterium J06649_5]
MSKSSAVFKTHISSALKAPAQLSTAIARLLLGFGLISGSVFFSISSGAAMASDLKKVADFKAVNTLTVKNQAIKNQAIKNQAVSALPEQAHESLSIALPLAIASPSTKLSSQLKLADFQEATDSNAGILSEAESSSSEGLSIESALEKPAELAQVTSVSELSDVQPGDWAFTALQRLVEEYGCLEGYPDRSFQGNRALTRYEFAAGLNACLDTVIQILPADGLFDSAYRLQEEFAAELAAVRSQVDTLELDVAELEANQFSTTTKFNAQLFGSLNFATASDDVQAEGINVFAPARDPITNDPVVRTITDDPEPTFSYYTWLNFTTSFSGEDRLQLQLTSGDGNGGANAFGSAGLFNTFGVPFTLQTGTTGGQDNLIVREVFYSFPVGEKLSFTVGPAINWYRHFDNNRFTFYLTGANSFNSSGGTQVNAIDRGAGAVAQWDIADWLDFRVGYLAENTEFLPGPRSAQENGLFAGTTTLTGQVGVYPTDDLNLRFLYTRSNIEPNANGFVGGAISEPIYGFADDGFGGPLRTAAADTFLVNFDWLVTDGFGLFGRYSYGSTDLFPVSDTLPDGQINAQSVQVGVAFPDLFKKGAQGIISYVQPFDVLDGRDFLASGGGDGAVQQELEVSYRYPLSQNIALVPSYYWINNVNNFGDNPDIHVFNLQTQFSF